MPAGVTSGSSTDAVTGDGSSPLALDPVTVTSGNVFQATSTTEMGAGTSAAAESVTGTTGDPRAHALSVQELFPLSL